MNINVTMFFQLFAFGLFVWFCMSKVWPPLMQAMAERQKKIADGLAAADRGEQALADAAKHKEEALAQARADAQDILANANRQASEIVERAKTDARNEGERIIAGAQAELDAEVNKAKAALRAEVSAIALSAAEKILEREVDASAHEGLLKDLAAQV